MHLRLLVYLSSFVCVFLHQKLKHAEKRFETKEATDKRKRTHEHCHPAHTLAWPEKFRLGLELWKFRKLTNSVRCKAHFFLLISMPSQSVSAHGIDALFSCRLIGGHNTHDV